MEQRRAVAVRAVWAVAAPLSPRRQGGGLAALAARW
jgi:hypothetical protein